MNLIRLLPCLALAAPAFAPRESLADPPLSLHPGNPHYFLFRGKPAVLITSGEHYGAVLNLDFDPVPYLDELRAHGFNLTRTFSGSYREIPGSFGIRGNTLAPRPGRYICPWARSETPGYFDGGARFDLRNWDEAYFKRLKAFLSLASERGVIVELVLFCPMYEEALWKACPMNAANNVNGVGDVPSKEVYTLAHPDLLEVQLALVRKIVLELKDFDNLYYEICNEPYFGGVTLEWQHRIADEIAAAEAGFPFKHLIAQNIANGSARVERPHRAVSILNFHYAHPPRAVAENYGLGRAIGFDESGFRGPGDTAYRTEAWDFIAAGGAVYSNLDYSFTPENEGGDAVPDAPGGGGKKLRTQLAALKRCIEGFDLPRMAPLEGFIRGGLPRGISGRAIGVEGKAYLLYFHNGLDSGPFSVRWTGKVEAPRSGKHTFHTFSNDGVRLWIDGRLIIDNWTDHAGTEDSGSAELEAGKLHDLKMEYYQNGGSAAAKLSWSAAGARKEIIPEARLRLPGGDGKGLRGEYFQDRELKRSKMTRTDAKVDFDWGGSTPFGTGPVGSRIEVEAALPSGTWRLEWLNPVTGGIDRSEDVEHGGGTRKLASPEFRDDAALRITGL